MNEERRKVTGLVWDGEDLAPLFARITQLGAENILFRIDYGKRLLGIKRKAEPVTKDGDGDWEWFNFAHLCPGDPRCVG